jgi:hypothetical protein
VVIASPAGKLWYLCDVADACICLLIDDLFRPLSRLPAPGQGCGWRQSSRKPSYAVDTFKWGDILHGERGHECWEDC